MFSCLLPIPNCLWKKQTRTAHSELFSLKLPFPQHHPCLSIFFHCFPSVYPKTLLQSSLLPREAQLPLMHWRKRCQLVPPPCAILARSRRGELSAPWPLLPTLPCFFPACVAHCSVVHSSQMSMQCCLFCISWGRGESSWDQAGLFLQLSKAWQQMTYKTAVLIRQNKNRNRNSKQTLCPFRCWEPRIHAALGRPWWVFTQQTVKIPSVGRNFFLSDHLRYTIFFRFLFFFLEKTSLFIKNFYMTASCCSCR